MVEEWRAAASVMCRWAGAADLDLPEQVGDVLIVKGQRAAQQRIQDDAAARHIHLWAAVQLPRDHLHPQKVTYQRFCCLETSSLKGLPYQMNVPKGTW